MNPTLVPSPLNPTATPPQDPVALAQSRQALVEKIDWLERLGSNPDLARFFQVVQNRMDTTERKASDIEGNDAAKRDAYAQCHFELATMMKWPARELAAAKAMLKKGDESARGV